MDMESFAGIRVEKATLYDQVLSRLRDLIIEGHLKPGDRIDEGALIDQLGVSRTPFREAMRTLAAEGLIETRSARGSIVRSLSAEEVRSILELLSGLERMAGEWACQRASDAELAALIDIHRRMMGYYEVRDRLPYYKLNQEFHSGLVAAAGNPSLSEVHGKLQARIKRMRFVGTRREEYWRAAVEEHGRMAEALARRDGPALGEIMARHLDRAWDRVRDIV